MYQTNLIVRTKLAPPRLQKFTLMRPRLMQRLMEARYHRLTIVQAGPGYGKSTALASLTNKPVTLIWYRLDSEDADPQRFLVHLLYSFATVQQGVFDATMAILEEWSSNRSTISWSAVIDSLINDFTSALDSEDDLFLILDDAHLLHHVQETINILNRLVEFAPDNLHIILSMRHSIEIPLLLQLRVRGELLEINQAELAFNPQEIDNLFRTRFDHILTPEQIVLLVEKLEGWPIALHLVWKNLQKDDGATFAEAVAQLSGSTGDLFTYLTQEVLTQQPEDIQEFLRITSVLRQLTADRCDYLREAGNSKEILSYLFENGLFVVDSGEGQMRYHHLFRELLIQQLSVEEKLAAHRRLAQYDQDRGEDAASIYHWLQGEAFEEAAVILDRLGSEMVRVGQLDTLAGWIGAIPPDILAHHPPLLTCLGDIARLHSRFEEAIGWYQQAEQLSRTLNNLPALGQALRGQARLYLDTVNPNRAEELLQEALRLSFGLQDREIQARLHELLSENLLNLGRAEEAKRYQEQARELRQEGPSQVELPVRILLRTGRLDEARQLLEDQAEKERQEPVLRPRAHRETLLLLSLILAYEGEQELAMQTALEGTERGRLLQSDYVMAVGYMRQGHAWLLLKDQQGFAEAARVFQKAIAVSNNLQTTRLKVEACWGLCQAAGFVGQLEAAREYAEEGIVLADKVGDEWVAAGIRVTMGAAYALVGESQEAGEWLRQGGSSFRECNDTFGTVVSLLWQCLIWYGSGDEARLQRDLEELLRLVREHEYGFLFLRKTLFGPPDPRVLVPLLLQAKEWSIHADFANQLLNQLGLAQAQSHPGYQLRVHSLGAFQLRRGANLVEPKEWRRKKARQLFQLLLTYRRTQLHREQIVEMLWPDLDPQSAQRDFKIAYNALCNVLEPNRQRNHQSSFISREGSRYGISLGADLWFDVSEFDHLSASADRLLLTDPDAAREMYRQALALYQGNYLQEYPYEEWAQQERLRLLNRFIRTSERLARSLIKEMKWEEVEDVCQKLLLRDSYWEPAYQMLIETYIQLGNNSQALRAYQRCEELLAGGLNIAPTGKTRELLQEILDNSA
ncbi:MAG: BTAD domain-containing putative transcriptional regulator [Candidatus Promineifilaceae bacterium]